MSGPNPEDLADAAKGLGEIAKAGLAVYNDLAAPTAREVGSTAGQIARTLLKPVRATFATIEQIEDWLGDELKDRFARRRLSVEDAQPPDPQVYASTVFGLISSGNVEELREMFASLLATAMDPRTAAEAHPSFAEIIRQMSSDEARLIRWLSSNAELPVDVQRHMRRDLNGDVSSLSDTFFLPPDNRPRLTVPTALNVYLINLQRLGLVDAKGPQPGIDGGGARRRRQAIEISVTAPRHGRSSSRHAVWAFVL